MLNEIFGIVYFVAASHALLIVIVLWRKQSAENASHILAVIMMILSYKSFEGGIVHFNYQAYVPHLTLLLSEAGLYLAPLFYLYVLSITRGKTITAKLLFIHLLPGLLFWAIRSPEVFTSAENKIIYWESVLSTEYSEYKIAKLATTFSIKIYAGVYLALGVRLLHLFGVKLNQVKADDSSLVMAQLRFLAMSLVILHIVWICLFTAQHFAELGSRGLVVNVTLLSIAIIVIVFGYFGLHSPSFALTKEEREVVELNALGFKEVDDGAAGQLVGDAEISVKSEVEDVKHIDILEEVVGSNSATRENFLENELSNRQGIKYINSLLPDSTLDIIAAQLTRILEDKALYLDDKLSLSVLADAIDVKAFTLSQVISQHLDTNFYKLVNTYRVRHAAMLLDDVDNTWSIERIALESGFSNRVTFNKAFKALMHCTASTYRKDNLQNIKAAQS